jgi:hypothetical protein
VNAKKSFQLRVRGWFPQESNITYATQTVKPRWRRPVWVALTLVIVVALAFAAYAGAQTIIRYSNPQADVTAAYFEKTTNVTNAKDGDTVEVNVTVYWHGYVVPEFKRQVQIIDAYPKANFELVIGNNTLQYSGYGGVNPLHYLLKVTHGNGASIELPKPRLILDDTELPLTSVTAKLEWTPTPQQEP